MQGLQARARTLQLMANGSTAPCARCLRRSSQLDQRSSKLSLFWLGCYGKPQMRPVGPRPGTVRGRTRRTLAMVCVTAGV